MWNIGWSDMLVLTVPVLEKVIRSIAVYVFLVIGLRVAGKRGLASLNSFDLIVLLLISNTVQNAIIGNDNSVTGGFIGAATLLIVNMIVVRFFYRYPALDRIVEGQPTVLINGGRVIERNLRRELISTTELEEAARKQGFRSLHDVEHAEIDPGGSLIFLRRDDTPEARFKADVIERLDQIGQQLAALHPTLNPPRTPPQEQGRAS